MKDKVQTGGFSLVSAEQMTGNSERLYLDLGRVQSQRCCTGVELETCSRSMVVKAPLWRALSSALVPFSVS